MPRPVINGIAGTIRLEGSCVVWHTIPNALPLSVGPLWSHNDSCAYTDGIITVTAANTNVIAMTPLRFISLLIGIVNKLYITMLIVRVQILGYSSMIIY